MPTVTVKVSGGNVSVKGKTRTLTFPLSTHSHIVGAVRPRLDTWYEVELSNETLRKLAEEHQTTDRSERQPPT